MNYDMITIRLKDNQTVLEYKDCGKTVFTYAVSKVDFEGGDTLNLDFKIYEDLEPMIRVKKNLPLWVFLKERFLKENTK